MTENSIDWNNFHQNFIQINLANEIKYYMSNDPQNSFKDHYLAEIKKRCFINNIEKKENVTYILDTTNKKFTLKTIKSSEYNQTLNYSIYAKRWSLLKEFHKIQKIREYINELPYKESLAEGMVANNRTEILRKSIELIKDKKNPMVKNAITYDPPSMKITEISFVVQDSKGFYQIKKPSEKKEITTKKETTGKVIAKVRSRKTKE
jgi:hypothetical protein